MLYSKHSEEYIENGLYKINQSLFYSLWSFKNKFGIPNNTPLKNYADAELIKGLFYYSVPDKGGFDKVKLFSESTLKSFYKVIVTSDSEKADKFDLKSKEASRIVFQILESERWFIFEPLVPHKNPEKAYLFCGKTKTFKEFKLELINKRLTKYKGNEQTLIDEYEKHLSSVTDLPFENKSKHSWYYTHKFQIDSVSIQSPLFKEIEDNISRCSIGDNLILNGEDVYADTGLIGFIPNDKLPSLENIGYCHICNINFGSSTQPSTVEVGLRYEKEKIKLSCPLSFPNELFDSRTVEEIISGLKLKEENDLVVFRNVYIAKNNLVDYESSFIVIASENDISIPMKDTFDIGYGAPDKWQLPVLNFLGVIPEKLASQLIDLPFKKAEFIEGDVYVHEVNIKLTYENGNAFPILQIMERLDY
ncbi:hypothetical protein [Thalassotalea piscium]|uniref:Uncharacterized protein n=1 Tax=Thalassotalea piscium TaxID=1230533 RepID=A0A7X0NIP6_9GAMM|nr:hypothetical protein [Thalassotalea piscium]MBB6544103.1 hypothetical protein [Thalassotalea piscium]